MWHIKRDFLVYKLGRQELTMNHIIEWHIASLLFFLNRSFVRSFKKKYYKEWRRETSEEVASRSAMTIMLKLEFPHCCSFLLDIISSSPLFLDCFSLLSSTTTSTSGSLDELNFQRPSIQFTSEEISTCKLSSIASNDLDNHAIRYNYYVQFSVYPIIVSNKHLKLYQVLISSTWREIYFSSLSQNFFFFFVNFYNFFVNAIKSSSRDHKK